LRDQFLGQGAQQVALARETTESVKKSGAAWLGRKKVLLPDGRSLMQGGQTGRKTENCGACRAGSAGILDGITQLLVP
jgi:hypothetical protein